MRSCYYANSPIKLRDLPAAAILHRNYDQLVTNSLSRTVPLHKSLVSLWVIPLHACAFGFHVTDTMVGNKSFFTHTRPWQPLTRRSQPQLAGEAPTRVSLNPPPRPVHLAIRANRNKVCAAVRTESGRKNGSRCLQGKLVRYGCLKDVQRFFWWSYGEIADRLPIFSLDWAHSFPPGNILQFCFSPPVSDRRRKQMEVNELIRGDRFS